MTGGLVVSVLLVELSSEEVLLDRVWSAGRLLVSSSICNRHKTEKSQGAISACDNNMMLNKEKLYFATTLWLTFVIVFCIQYMPWTKKHIGFIITL